MPAQKAEEDRLRVGLSALDKQIEKFSSLLEKVKAKQHSLNDTVRKTGFSPIPIKIKPSLQEETDLEKSLSEHLAELHRLRNLTAKKLEEVVKEEELFERLHADFKGRVRINKLGRDDFEIQYADDETRQIAKEIEESRKAVSSLRPRE